MRPARVQLQLLDEDPDLAVALPADQLAAATEAATAPVESVPPGDWAHPPENDPGTFGLLVLDGLLMVRLSFGSRAHLELLGPGDVLRPWDIIEDAAGAPLPLDWRILEQTRYAILDRGFVVSVARWPEILSALAERLVRRARRLVFQLAVTGTTGVEERVALMLWHFAEQWGQVTPEGVRLRLPLTHTQLSEIVEAARPTVSTALGALRRAGVISTSPGGEWILHGSPPARAAEISRRIAIPG